MMQVPTPQPPMVLALTGPNYRLGLDNGFVSSLVVKVKDPTGNPPTPAEF